MKRWVSAALSPSAYHNFFSTHPYTTTPWIPLSHPCTGSYFSNCFLLHTSLTLPIQVCLKNKFCHSSRSLAVSLVSLRCAPSALLPFTTQKSFHLMPKPHTSLNLNANDSLSPWPFPSVIFLAAEFCMTEEKGSRKENRVYCGGVKGYWLSLSRSDGGRNWEGDGVKDKWKKRQSLRLKMYI